MAREATRKVLCAAAFAIAAALAPPAAAQPKHLAPIPAATVALMAAKNTSPGAPILMRVFKKESELEVWKQARDGRYVLLKTFPICRWSGQLGPKMRVGDRQAPEGFYTITPRQMNPNSAYHLSFDTGFPNAYDRARGATGSALMVHGTCSSMGCYAMTDAQVGELFALAREAFAGGQAAFQFHAYPFRMTAQNMARHRTEPHIGFWRMLKEGYDRFEATAEEPSVSVAGGRYVFGPFRNPEREALAQARLAEESRKIETLIADGIAAIRTTYSDGGTHPSFASLARMGSPRLGMVSRPEALALAGREITVIPARKAPPLPPVLVAGLRPAEAAAESSGPDAMSVFVFASLGYGTGGSPAAASALIPGSARIVEQGFGRAGFQLALR
ncbi:L,D-transpeptidase family protein [Enterovirga aerilata]|uniref:L,D-transpeptidase family protein n=1 Tax=Enterovirga aerilata TaxID=2730920 RepID=UPI001FEE181C|nr:murein L,D-transpeptidase family protein [Enterovirga sp. DB1703]